MTRPVVVLLSLLVALAGWPLAAGAAEGELRIAEPDLANHPQVHLPVTLPATPDGELTDDAFELREDGEPRDVVVEHRGSEDLQLLLLLDVTGSMGGPPLAGAKQAASRLVDDLPAATDIAVMQFATKATLLAGFDADTDAHLEAIDGLEATGRTALYDAVVAAVAAFPDGRDVSRVIILLADGEDNESDADVDAAIEALRDADVSLTSVEYLTDFTDEAAVRTLATATDGQVLEADDATELVAVYEQLAGDLVSRYLVSYTSTANGSVELDLRVDHPDGELIASRRFTSPAVEEQQATTDEEGSRSSAAPPTVIDPPRWSNALVVTGSVLWFTALALLVFVLAAPRHRSQLAGTGTHHAGSMPGLSELTNRATLLAERGLTGSGYQRGLNAALERAGINLRPSEFVVLQVSALVTAAVLGSLLSGWVAAIALTLGILIASSMVVRMRTKRREARFNDQLGETLQLLAGSMRAGYSLMQAVDSVAREAAAPTSVEFSRLVVETRLGRDLNEALAAMADRMQSEDFAWIVQAIEIHREIGGDLAEVLDTVAGTIRERNQIRRQVKALSAEGRLSGYILLALPFAVGGLIMATNPSYLGELTSSGGLGWSLIAIGGLLMITGVVWMHRLVRLEF